MKLSQGRLIPGKEFSFMSKNTTTFPVNAFITLSAIGNCLINQLILVCMFKGYKLNQAATNY